MAAYSLKAIQKIPASLDEVWAFFSNPNKLQVITPDDMRFTVISKEKVEEIYSGQIIEYKVSPVLRIPLYWMTEIKEVKNKEFFIDEQRKGPYKLWRHQHFFKAIPGGVEMTDVVEYKMPFWIFGKIANALFVKKKLKKIFDYRFQKTEELLGKWPNGK